MLTAMSAVMFQFDDGRLKNRKKWPFMDLPGSFLNFFSDICCSLALSAKCIINVSALLMYYLPVFSIALINLWYNNIGNEMLSEKWFIDSFSLMCKLS